MSKLKFPKSYSLINPENCTYRVKPVVSSVGSKIGLKSMEHRNPPVCLSIEIFEDVLSVQRPFHFLTGSIDVTIGLLVK